MSYCFKTTILAEICIKMRCVYSKIAKIASVVLRHPVSGGWGAAHRPSQPPTPIEKSWLTLLILAISKDIRPLYVKLEILLNPNLSGLRPSSLGELATLPLPPLLMQLTVNSCKLIVWANQTRFEKYPQKLTVQNELKLFNIIVFTVSAPLKISLRALLFLVSLLHKLYS